MQNLFGRSKSGETDSEWLSVSDLMSGLMVIFLFMAILIIRSLPEEQQRVQEERQQLDERQRQLEEERRQLLDQQMQWVEQRGQREQWEERRKRLEEEQKQVTEKQEQATAQQQRLAERQAELEAERERFAEERKRLDERQQRVREIVIVWREEIHDALEKEFKDDLPRWNAELLEDLRIRFKGPNVQFALGDSAIPPKFKADLAEFFPRYILVLSSDKLWDKIEEIRIEGHTSSEWKKGTPPMQAYLNNMRLSQDRTREVLKYVLSLDNLSPENRDWARPLMTANGLSSSKLEKDAEGNENKTASRRVEFQVRSKAHREVIKILEENQ